MARFGSHLRGSYSCVPWQLCPPLREYLLHLISLRSLKSYLANLCCSGLYHRNLRNFMFLVCDFRGVRVCRFHLCRQPNSRLSPQHISSQTTFGHYGVYQKEIQKMKCNSGRWNCWDLTNLVRGRKDTSSSGKQLRLAAPTVEASHPVNWMRTVY